MTRTHQLASWPDFQQLVAAGAGEAAKMACMRSWAAQTRNTALSATCMRNAALMVRSGDFPESHPPVNPPLPMVNPAVNVPQSKALVADWQIPMPGSIWTAGGQANPAPAKAPAHGGKWKRFVAASDIHGDMQDEVTCEALWKFIDHWQPQIRCCLGDVWDFRPLRGGASPEEKTESMQQDYRAGTAWLERFFGADGDKYLNLGNHDERVWLWAKNKRGVEQDFAVDKVQLMESEFGRLGIKWVPYHKRTGVIRIGHLKLLHGFAYGIYAARQTALVYGSCLMGHVHAIDEHHIPGLERRACRIIGAMCQLDMEYNSRQPNSLRQANGWAFGAVSSVTGEYIVFQAEKMAGEWLVPSDLASL